MGARKYSLDEEFFDRIDSEEKAYWLGFLAADGGFAEATRSIQLVVQLASGDREQVVKFGRAVGSNAPVRDYVYKGKSCARLALTAGRLFGSLSALGLGFRKSHTALPWDGPQELMRHYWRGVFDGDGSIFPSNTWWVANCVGSRPMMEAYSRYVHDLTGAKASLRLDKSIWEVRINGVYAPQLLIRELYGDAKVALNRKAILATRLMEQPIKRRRTFSQKGGEAHDSVRC